MHLKVQNSTLSCSAHASSHFGVRAQTTTVHHNMRAAQHELPLVQACAELLFDFDLLLILFESLKLIQLAFRSQVRDDVQLPRLAMLLEFAH